MMTNRGGTQRSKASWRAQRISPSNRLFKSQQRTQHGYLRPNEPPVLTPHGDNVLMRTTQLTLKDRYPMTLLSAMVNQDLPPGSQHAQ